MGLSKTLYQYYLQCPKLFWLKLNRKAQKDIFTPNKSLDSIMENGILVGELACRLYPNGTRISFEDSSFFQKAEMTQKLIKEQTKYIYEATFIYDDIVVMVDILEVLENGSVVINEVKSSTKKSKLSDDKKAKEKYLTDIALQYYVIQNLGYNIACANLIRINANYERYGELELEKLFVIDDVTQEIIDLQTITTQNLQEAKSFLHTQKSEPQTTIGLHCFTPYECEAKEYCFYKVLEIPRQDTIFNIVGDQSFTKKKMFELYKQNLLKLDDIKDTSCFKDKQRLQIQSFQAKSRVVKKDEIKDFLQKLTYPIYHLDFETFSPVVPLWDNTKPNMKIPFQYSLHIEYENGDTEHKEFLPQTFCDPRLDLIEQLIKDIPQNACVLAYHMSFEKDVLKSLAETFPQYAEHLLNIIANLKDLESPFKERHFYDYKQGGSHSIKVIQPILAPHIENGYKDLAKQGGIANGGDAMLAFPAMESMDKDSIHKTRQSLLAYCKLDTLAMVEVLRGLRKLVV